MIDSRLVERTRITAADGGVKVSVKRIVNAPCPDRGRASALRPRIRSRVAMTIASAAVEAEVVACPNRSVGVGCPAVIRVRTDTGLIRSVGSKLGAARAPALCHRWGTHGHQHCGEPKGLHGFLPSIESVELHRTSRRKHDIAKVMPLSEHSISAVIPTRFSNISDRTDRNLLSNRLHADINSTACPSLRLLCSSEFSLRP